MHKYTYMTDLPTRIPRWCQKDGSKKQNLWEEKGTRAALTLRRSITQSNKAWYDQELLPSDSSFGVADIQLGASVVTRILAPTPDSQNDALLEPAAENEDEQEAESADGDDIAKSERGQVAEVADQDEGKC